MLSIAELFYSIQGEGSCVGIPSVFVRTSGCNLRCAWCDTPYTSWEPRGTDREVEDLLAEILGFSSTRHVVLTGGEPMLHPDVVPLVAALRDAGRHVTVETAATIWRPVDADLFSISPKLAHSVPDDPDWGPRHDAARMRTDVIAAMMAAADFQLKFVVGSSSDLVEIEELLAALPPVEPWRVQLMPEARSVAELDAAQGWVSQVCKETGFRFCDRQHLRLYGNTPGT